MTTLGKMHMRLSVPAKAANAGRTGSAGNNPRHAPVRVVTPISVPIYELPEYVCVETKWVTRRYAMENNLPVNGLQEATTMTNGGVKDGAQKPAQQDRLNEATGMFASEATAPCRERAIQTEERTTKDVGIQCRRDSVEWNLPEEQPKDTPNQTPSSSQDGRFLTYVSENTSMFPNGMLECQICGDIANTLLEHQAHMTVHFGPSALCCNCGQQLEHEILISRHNLSCPALALRKSCMLLKCPHLLCNTMSHSEMQLLQHLKMHSGKKCFRCLTCRRFFKSTTAILIHRKKEQKCSKAKLLTLFGTHNKLGKGKTDPKRCSVCMKRFSSERICSKHRRKCILGHLQQLSKTIFKKMANTNL
ncbi:zinc finger protein with KRAB and SCAN domains 7 [Drosophila rhopaloa]|uniref:Zinc finger protein with KRAB and SCAN domains 7 n=1 Tax=Drosophila rhopaloa TaxID=1041015 RepID=A0A6P4E296_DRORH|nr:zinc finger protein with KRAB and SCAN domains 7 [Drosophila rhopaloa]